MHGENVNKKKKKNTQTRNHERELGVKQDISGTGIIKYQK